MATITQQDIQNHVPFILKWSKNPGDDGAYNPGWKQQMESDRFLELIENRPSIMNDAVFHKMDALEEDISYMQVEVDLHSMDALSGDDKGAQIDDITTLPETVPAFSRSKLRARGMTAFTYTPKTFLLANIEKQSFLNHIESILAERAGYSAEVISIYGKRKTTGATSNGLDHIDGFFAQLEAIKAAYDDLENPDTTVPMGYMPDVDPTKPLVPQFKLMITQFTKQKGNRSLAKIYVSATTEANLILEADERPTEKGDNLYFDNGQLTLWGVPIVHADVLDNPRNGYGEQVLMANPDSLIYGFLEEITSENDYILKKKAYLSTVDVFFDVLLLYNKDALAMIIPVNEVNPEITKYDLSFTVNDGTDPIKGATVKIGSKTSTTGDLGGCTLKDIEEGSQSVEVSATGYVTKTESITVDVDHTSFTISLTSE